MFTHDSCECDECTGVRNGCSIYILAYIVIAIPVVAAIVYWLD